MATRRRVGKSGEGKGAPGQDPQKKGSGTPSPKVRESATEGAAEVKGESEAEAGAEVTEGDTRLRHRLPIRDAQQVHDAALAHRDVSRDRGLTDEELGTFKGQIELAVEVEGVGGRLSLERLARNQHLRASPAAREVCRIMHHEGFATTF